MNPADIVILVCCALLLTGVFGSRYFVKKKKVPKSSCSIEYGCSRADEMKRAMKKARREIKKDR